MKRVALFVGVNEYRDKGINNLSCAVNDAATICKHFTGKGYETHLMTDGAVSYTGVCDRISSICAGLKAGDVFLFYFSGHGHEVADNHYLLCPAASTATLDINGGGDAIPLAVVRRFSENCCEAGIHRLFILDCCRNNVRAGEKSVAISAAGKGIELVTEDHNDGILPPWILRSCQAGQRSYEDTAKGHGFFTLALEKTLTDETVNTFSGFFESLKRNMQHFIHPGDQRITLGEYSGGAFPLFDNWVEKIEAPAPEPEKTPVLPVRELTNEERAQFHILLEEVRNTYKTQVAVCDYPAQMNSALTRIRRSLEKLSKAEPAAETMQELTSLKSSLKDLLHFNQARTECENLKKQCELEVIFLREAAVPLPTQYTVLNSAAREAMEKCDWEAALPVWQEVKRLLLEEKGKITPEYQAIIKEIAAARALGIVFSEDNKTITACRRKEIGELHIPGSVTAIGDGAFRGCTNLKSLIIPEGVTTIGQSAFEGLPSLISVQLPQSLTHLGQWAFAHCSNLESVRLGNTSLDLTSSHGKTIFKGCKKVKISGSSGETGVIPRKKLLSVIIKVLAFAIFWAAVAIIGIKSNYSPLARYWDMFLNLFK